MKKSKSNHTIVSERFTRLFAAVVVVIGIIVLIGWFSGLMFLTRFTSNEVAMAPSTAYAFIGLAVGICFYLRPQKTAINRNVSIASAVMVICLSFLLVITNIFKYYANWEHLYIKIPETQLSMQLGHMSLITAILFIISGFAFLFLLSNRKIVKTFSIILTLIISIISFILLLGYAFGAPFFYFDNFIPPAVLTVSSFLLVSLGLIAASDKNILLIKSIWKTSTSAKLLRIFLPATIAITVIESLIIIRILPLLNIHPAIGVSLVSLIVVVAVIVVISIISKSIGKALDSALENLSESEARFRKISENAPILINSFDEDGRCLFWNKQCNKTFGWTIEEINEHKVALALFYPDPAVCKEVIRTVTSDPDGSFREWHPVTKDGKILNIMWANFSLPNGRVFSMGHDITERKKLEEISRGAKEYAENIVATVREPLVILDKNLRVVSAGHSFYTSFEVTPEETVGQLLYDLGNRQWDIPLLRNLMEKVLPEKKTVEDYEIEHNFEDIGKKTMLLNARQIIREEEEEEEELILLAIEDITKRKKLEFALKESEEKLNALFTSLTEMVVMHELVLNAADEAIDYRIIDCNKVFTEVTGIGKEDAIGKLASEVYQTDPPPYLEICAKVGLSGDPHEFTTFNPALDKHFMISVVSPQVGKFATITTDISDMMQIQEMVMSKNKEMENYLYIASHDLRAPLVNILGFSQRLKKQANSIKSLFADKRLEPEIHHQLANIIDENIPKTLNFIYTNTGKMDALLNGLLQLSRTGRIEMNIQKIDMNALFANILQGLDFQIKEACCEIHLDPLPECYGDEALLDQMFTNIISNALKYKDAGRPLEITVSAKNFHNKVVYTIRDTGKGIAQKYLEKIWGIFYRVDPRSEIAGEGLGLSLVKQIAEKHKGKAWVESVENKGSVFHIALKNRNFTKI